ncbi:hypothetical protein [Marinobacter sp.]|uniref:hypothetical protein n=1 Tax=Marinobacter sp. TaxID=50741 RepID=UPI003A95058F
MDFLNQVLKHMPSDCGVIITQYKTALLSDHVLTEQNIAILKSKYSNIIYDPRLDVIPNVSQVILPRVYGVITVSSSVGIQAKLLGKYLATYGTSHLNLVSDEVLGGASLNLRKCEDSDLHADWLASMLGSYIVPLAALEQSKHAFRSLVNGARNKSNTQPVTIFSASELTGFYAERYCPYTTQWKQHNKGQATNIDAFKLIIDRIFSEQIKVISFDVFDTLIARKSLSPFGVFLEVEHRILRSQLADIFARCVDVSGFGNYCALRRHAETKARHTANQMGLQDCTIDDIQANLAELISNEGLARDLIKLELAVEHDFVEERRIGSIIYSAAKLSGKPIFLLSDMYLPSKTINSLLIKTGYDGLAKILVSCEYGVNKGSGGLFIALMQNHSLLPEDILHIGDNAHGDYAIPKSLGINASLVLSRMALWRRSLGAAYRVKAPKNLKEELYYGMQARHLFDTPLPDGGIAQGGDRHFPIFRGSASFLGYTVVAPLVTATCHWIQKNVIDNCVDKVLFCARDGYIFYSVMCKLYPESKHRYEYLHISRRTANLASISTDADIERTCKLRFSDCTIDELFNARFGVLLSNQQKDALQANVKISHHRDISKVLEAAKLLRHPILKNASRARNNLKSLIGSLGVTDLRTAAIFDLGYGGSIQKAVEKAANQEFKAGLYFATFISARSMKYKKKNINVFTIEDIDPVTTTIPFVQAVHVFETLFSHVDGSTVEYLSCDGTAVPVLMSENQNAKKTDFAGLLWSGCHAFVEDYLALGPKSLELSWSDILSPFDVFIKNPHPVDLTMFLDCSFENSFSGEPSAPIISSARTNSWWKFGQKIYNDCDASMANTHSLQNLSTAGLEKMYIDYIEKMVVSKYARRIEELEARLKLYEGEPATQSKVMSGATITSVSLPEVTPPWFDEERYLNRNLDVKASVIAEVFPDGYSHYRAHGYAEGRPLR